MSNRSWKYNLALLGGVVLTGFSNNLCNSQRVATQTNLGKTEYVTSISQIDNSKASQLEIETREVLDRVLIEAAGEDQILDWAEKAKLIRDLGYAHTLALGASIKFRNLKGKEAGGVEIGVWDGGERGEFDFFNVKNLNLRAT